MVSPLVKNDVELKEIRGQATYKDVLNKAYQYLIQFGYVNVTNHVFKKKPGYSQACWHSTDQVITQ